MNGPQLADTLLAWLKVAGLEQRVLIANSFGCQVVVDLAYRYPASTSRLVLIGPTVDRHARNLPAQLWRWRLNKRHELPSQDQSIAMSAELFAKG